MINVTANASEGAVTGWINTGEWLEYSVDVSSSGMYDFAFRYASGNSKGGGPFQLELDGQTISGDITVPSTSSSVWTIWATKTVSNIPLIEGKHILKVAFKGGEFNFGKMTFTRSGDLTEGFPIAHAGADFKVLLPQNTASLDASASTETSSANISYQWKQIFGPSKVIFLDTTAMKPQISNLSEGMNMFRLTVKNMTGKFSTDEVLVMVSANDNVAPVISLASPVNGSDFTAGKPVILSANASDFDGQVIKVDFYEGESLIATDSVAPYLYTWSPVAGDYVISAKATDNGGAIGVTAAAQIKVHPVMSCTYTSTEASQGSFTSGYIATFETVGSDVTITFELLDNKPGLIAYLWNYTSGFAESSMSNTSGKIFTKTLSGLATGSVIKIACKFAFAGGMSVTKQFSYTVGNDCSKTAVDELNADEIWFYPNPVQDELYLQLPDAAKLLRITDISGKVVLEEKNIPSSFHLNVSHLNKGVYFIQIKDEGIIRSAKLMKR